MSRRATCSVEGAALQAEYAIIAAGETCAPPSATCLANSAARASVLRRDRGVRPPPARASGRFQRLAPPAHRRHIAEVTLRSSKASLDSANSVFWPTLSASYSRSRGGATEFPNKTNSWSAGASLSYALFVGGPAAAYLNTKASRLGYERTQSDLSAARQAALSDLETAWSNYADAADQVKVQDALLEASRQRNDEADIRYGSGLMSFEIWEGIVSERVSTERQALSARRSAMDAETAWHRALGRALGE